MYIFANIQEITQFAYKNHFSEKKQKINTKIKKILKSLYGHIRKKRPNVFEYVINNEVIIFC